MTSSHIEEEMEKNVTEKKKLEERIQQLNNEIKTTSDELIALKQHLANNDQVKRNLEDNMRSALYDQRNVNPQHIQHNKHAIVISFIYLLFFTFSLTQISFSFSDLLRLREEKAKLKEIECNLLQKQEQLKENDMNQTQQTISSLESQIESLKSKVPFNLSTFVATIQSLT